jgi:hypothetical protein
MGPHGAAWGWRLTWAMGPHAAWGWHGAAWARIPYGAAWGRMGPHGDGPTGPQPCCRVLQLRTPPFALRSLGGAEVPCRSVWGSLIPLVGALIPVVGLLSWAGGGRAGGGGYNRNHNHIHNQPPQSQSRPEGHRGSRPCPPRARRPSPASCRPPPPESV